jgi:hypothetical protein
MSRTYHATGSVRGPCGHQHRTVATALKCAEKDNRGCNVHGGYSDRIVRPYWGGDLSRGEKQELGDLNWPER